MVKLSGMAKFGVNAVNAVLRDRHIVLPANVLAYGFSSPNQRSTAGNVTLQQKKEIGLWRQVAKLAEGGESVVWFMHLDDVQRDSSAALHETDTPNGVRLFWVRSDQRVSLNVTTHPKGVCIPLAELTSEEMQRLSRWHPDETAVVRREVEDEVEPSSEDARRRTLAAIVVRQGQDGFRRALLDAYGRKCAVTHSDCEDSLEAAHIRPYRGPLSNTPSNGLLLRADIHTLFDLGLLTVEPTGLTVQVAKRLRAGSYRDLHGRPLLVPKAEAERPSQRALAEHHRFATLAHGAD